MESETALRKRIAGLEAKLALEAAKPWKSRMPLYEADLDLDLRLAKGDLAKVVATTEAEAA